MVTTPYSTPGFLLSLTVDYYILPSIPVDCYRHALLLGLFSISLFILRANEAISSVVVLPSAFAALCQVRNWVSRNFVDMAVMVVYRGGYTLIPWTYSDHIFGTINIKPLKTVFPSEFLGVLCRPEMAHKHRILLYRFSLGPAVFDNLLYMFLYIIACRIPPCCHALHLTYKSFCLILWHDSTSATKTSGVEWWMLG